MLSFTLIHYGFFSKHCYHRPNWNTAVYKRLQWQDDLTPVIDFQGFIYIFVDCLFWQRNELLSFCFWRHRLLKDVTNFYKIKLSLSLSLPCNNKLAQGRSLVWTLAAVMREKNRFLWTDDPCQYGGCVFPINIL